MLAAGAIISVSSSLGYLLPAIIGLESMGVPSPGETALVAAAVLASQGKLQIWLVILIGVASAILGDNAGYWLGRRLGRGVLIAAGPFRARRAQLVEAGERFFAKHGSKSVFLARWVVFVRFAAAWLAGINRMRFREFFVWNALGGLTWGITYGLAGYLGGKAAAGVLASAGVAGAVLIALLFAGSSWLMRRRDHRAAAELTGERPGQRSSQRAAGDEREAQDEVPGSSSKEHELMQ